MKENVKRGQEANSQWTEGRRVETGERESSGRNEEENKVEESKGAD